MKKPKETEAFKRKIRDSYLNNQWKYIIMKKIMKYNENEKQKYDQRVKVLIMYCEGEILKEL